MENFYSIFDIFKIKEYDFYLQLKKTNIKIYIKLCSILLYIVISLRIIIKLVKRYCLILFFYK